MTKVMSIFRVVLMDEAAALVSRGCTSADSTLGETRHAAASPSKHIKQSHAFRHVPAARSMLSARAAKRSAPCIINIQGVALDSMTFQFMSTPQQG